MQTIPSDNISVKPVITAAAVAGATATHAAPSPNAGELVSRIQSTDDATRGPAWQGAAPYGAKAVKSLAAIMTHEDFEIARAAKRATWVIVRHAGRPGAAREARAVATELVALLANPAAAVRHEVLWMLSEIGGDDAIGPMAALLSNKDVRADALAALMRLPGRRSTAVIKSAFASVPEDFKFAVADALRRRGETVKGYASQKLVPTRKTNVTYEPPKPEPPAKKARRAS